MALSSRFETFIGALRFFTRLPIPGQLGYSSVALEKAIVYFPLAGVLLGAICAALFMVCALFWPKSLAVLVAMAATIRLTGALHEDGWSDVADGFGGGWDKQRILDIMRDSRLGSFGAVALTMLLLARYVTLLEIETAWLPFALIAGHAFSRLCATGIMVSMEYARTDGKGKPFSNHLSIGELAFVVLTGVAPLFCLPWRQAASAAVLALLATLWLARLFKRNIGGYTGDCLGATQQLAEVAFYAGLLCRFS